MQRLFISVNCNEKVKKQILSVQKKIKTLSIKGNFSLPENLHLTLVFIGETLDDAIQPIISIIDKALIPPVASFALTFTTAGCFKHSNKELWWTGTDQNDMCLDNLKTIRQRITKDLLQR